MLLDTIGERNAFHHIQTNGKYRDYKGFTASTSIDGGYTWSEKVDVTQFEGDNPYIRNATWTINNRGVIGVFWFDRRESGPDGHNLYFTYSYDHAQSFKKPIRISSKPSIPDTYKNMNDKRWPVGGEYFGLSTSKEGHFRVVWADHRTEVTQLYYALIQIK